PPPPPFPASGGISQLRAPRRRPVGAVAVAAALGVVVLAAVALWPEDRGTSSVVASGGDGAVQAYTCGTDLPLEIEVRGSTSALLPGPAPGRPPAEDGQLVRHWLRPDGSVEFRWPATPAPLYGDGAPSAPTAVVGGVAFPGRSEIDVRRPGSAVPTSPDAFEPDVVIARSARGIPVAAPCDVLELAVATAEGEWRSGLRPNPAGISSPYETVDLHPRILERRTVDAAPTTAVRCQGSDRSGTPPNRSGGPDRAMRGPEPADVLLRFVAAMPGTIPSGYVELAEPDGSITYAVDASGIGWTTILSVVRDADGWYLEGWTSSGC
ncbi:MAG TPA: hypothetical protein VGB03_00325, partial [Acidimicrobiales bacterium]